jgi:hypothetical protein
MKRLILMVAFLTLTGALTGCAKDTQPTSETPNQKAALYARDRAQSK